MPSRTWGVVAGAAAVGAHLVLVSTVQAGPDWIEVDDAGSTFFSAQVPIRPNGVMQLGTISGGLASGLGTPDFEDLYFFRIVEPGAISITLGFAEFDPVLYLFNITINHDLFGLLANDNMDDESMIPRIGPAATDGTGVIITTPGDYVLAVTGAGRVPVSRTGPIFAFASATEVSGPDGPGGFNPLEGWVGEGQQGRYRLVLEAADFPTTPAPGAGPGVVVGLMMMTRRRR